MMNKIEFQIVRWQNPYTPNSAMLRLLMEREGFKVIQCGGRTEAVFIRRKHSKNQSHWIISGALELSVDNVENYTLEAGDRDFLPAETYYSARVVGEEPVVYLVGEKM